MKKILSILTLFVAFSIQAQTPFPSGGKLPSATPKSVNQVKGLVALDSNNVFNGYVPIGSLFDGYLTDSANILSPNFYLNSPSGKFSFQITDDVFPLANGELKLVDSDSGFESGFLNGNLQGSFGVRDLLNPTGAGLITNGIKGYNSNSNWTLTKPNGDTENSNLTLPITGSNTRRLAISVNGNYANDNGNVTIPIGLTPPTTTGNTTTYPWVVGENGSGGTARLPAGDLGKNLANSDLLQTGVRNYDTQGNALFFKNLPDRRNTSTFNQFLGQDSNGQLARVGYQALIQLTQGMSDIQKRDFKASLNTQFSATNFAISSIIMPFVISDGNMQAVNVYGTNLNIDPLSATVSLVNSADGSLTYGTHYATQANGLVLVVEVDTSIIPVGDYYVRIDSGIDVYTSLVSFGVISSVEEIDLSGITWAQFSNPRVETASGQEGNTWDDYIQVDRPTNKRFDITALRSSTFTTGTPPVATRFKSNAIPDLINGDNFVIHLQAQSSQVSNSFFYATTPEYIGISDTSSSVTTWDNSTIIHTPAGMRYQSAAIINRYSAGSQTNSTSDIVDVYLVKQNNRVNTVIVAPNFTLIGQNTITWRTSYGLEYSVPYKNVIATGGSPRYEGYLEVIRAFKF